MIKNEENEKRKIIKEKREKKGKIILIRSSLSYISFSSFNNN